MRGVWVGATVVFLVVVFTSWRGGEPHVARCVGCTWFLTWIVFCSSHNMTITAKKNINFVSTIRLCSSFCRQTTGALLRDERLVEDSDELDVILNLQRRNVTVRMRSLRKLLLTWRQRSSGVPQTQRTSSLIGFFLFVRIDVAKKTSLSRPRPLSKSE